jgi:peptide/nickel transport system substrate-binding protein
VLGAAAMFVVCPAATAKSDTHAAITDQTLTLQFTAPVSLNPALGGTSESDVVFGALDYDSLIYQNGNGTYTGDLATAWSYKRGSHNEDFDMTIRKGAKFSDGSAVTPAAVVNSLEYFKKADGPQSSYLAALTSAKASGGKVELKFSAPTPDLPFLLSQEENAGQIIGPKGIADPKSLTTTSDGAGPYVLSSSQSIANSSYAFTLNSHYWNLAALHYKTIIVKVISDPQTAISSAQAGQIDALTSLPTTEGPAVESAGLNEYAEPFSIATLIPMQRSGNSPLAKVQVRQAINDSVDRAALAKGLGGTGSVPTDEVALPGTTGYDPSLSHAYTYSIAKAKKLLAQAGYPHGFKLTVLDTLALDPNGDIGAELKSELARIGITLTITETPSPAQFVPAALSKKYDAEIWPFSQDGNGFPYAVQFSLAPFTNVFNTQSPALDKLMATAGAASSKAADADYKKVTDYLTRNAWYVPLFSLQSVFGVSKSVTGVQAPSVLTTVIDPIGMTANTTWGPSAS